MSVLNKIDRHEVLRYLGFRGRTADSTTEAMIEEAVEEIMKNSQPRFAYSSFEIERNSGIGLKGTVFRLLGNDIARLLDGCEKCVLMAATLGAGFDMLLKRAQIKDMAKAVVFDSCGSAAIENVCDNVQELIKEEFAAKGFYITRRFSPGYGDMPLGQQHEFVSTLDTGRKIGLSVTSGGLLVPGKSVTAIIGLARVPAKNSREGCENCSNFKTCEYRNESNADGRRNFCLKSL